MRTVKINNELVYISPNWGVSDKINARTTCQFTVVDLLNLTDIFVGADVLIEEGSDDNITQAWNDLNIAWDDANFNWGFNTETLFAGTVDEVTIYEPYPNVIEYDITAVDYSAIPDKRLIADSVVNKTAGAIVREHILPILSEEGVTEGDIEEGQLITKAVFNYDTATVALDYIKNVTGLNWEIDFDRRLNLFRRDENTSPIALTDALQHSNFSYNKTRQQYRNKQYVRAGRGKTTLQQLESPTPKPDGVSRNFILRFPLAEKPRIFIDSVEVLPDDIGVNGLDQNRKFYFSFGSNVIAQDETEAPLLTETIQMTYTGLFPILVVDDRADEITERALKETSTSGIYEHINRESSINESEQALEFADGLLQKYGIIPATVSFQTEVHGIEAGQLLTVQKSLYGINDTFLVEEVSISAVGQCTVYNVKCLDGSALGGWEEYFKDILKGQREFIIQENEVLILLNVQSESVTMGADVDITVYESLYPSEGDAVAWNGVAGNWDSAVSSWDSFVTGTPLYPSNILYPGTITAEVNLVD
jgi:hypothetical protein